MILFNVSQLFIYSIFLSHNNHSSKRGEVFIVQSQTIAICKQQDEVSNLRTHHWIFTSQPDQHLYHVHTLPDKLYFE